ncbi:MAG TPA: hypothetical protein VH280_10145, partial [Verrucomicrobiae bacterium]|nr:hypothetical protein [Verrucomicrobiae bacterium]
RTGGQLEGGNEQFVLSGFAFAYRHAIFITNVKSMSRYNFDFFNGLLRLGHHRPPPPQFAAKVNHLLL